MANDYIEKLKERDKAKPLKKFHFAPGYDPIPACPSCGEVLILVKTDKFCRQCGQRLDVEDWAL